jgi:hypothetical protein
MTPRYRPARDVGVIALSIAALSSMASRGDEARTHALPTYDCGFQAIWILLSLEARPTAIPQLEARLPAPSPRGYSMKELRDAAGASGLGLTGIFLRKGSRVPDRPALVFLKRGQHGHFIVIRPVGHTGKLIQVIDSVEAPQVKELADLYASPEWTGLALVPSRPNWAARVAGALALLSGIGLILAFAIPRLRRRCQPAPPQIPLLI